MSENPEHYIDIRKKPEHYIDIRITFSKETDEFDPEYIYFEPQTAYPIESTLPDGAAEGVAETWAQTDHYQLLSTDLIVSALDGYETDLTR